jgi:hypothetical protein
MVYEKHIIWTDRDKIMKETAFVENKTDIMQHVLKKQ